MQYIIIIILILLIIIIYKKEKRLENFNNTDIDYNINLLLKDIYKTDFSYIDNISNMIDNLKKNNNINLTNNLKITGNIKINGSNINQTNKVTITNGINFKNRSNKDFFIDIFPQFFIMIWARDDYIPKGWARCDGKTYTVDENNNIIIYDEKIHESKMQIKTPDFRDVIPSGIEEFQKKTLTKRYGNEILLFNQVHIPYHEHSLFTSYNSNNPSVDGVGFDYINYILASTFQIDDREDPFYSDCSVSWDCIKSFGQDCCTIERTSAEMMNGTKLLVNYDGSNSDNILGKLGSPDFTKDHKDEIKYRTIFNNNNNVINTQIENDKEIYAPPPYYALHYIMKII